MSRDLLPIVFLNQARDQLFRIELYLVMPKFCAGAALRTLHGLLDTMLTRTATPVFTRLHSIRTALERKWSV